MARERKNPPPPEQRAGRRTRPTPAGERSRPMAEPPELELDNEELRALADEGIDPDDVRRVARERSEAQEASDHDRDTARDQLEGLVLEQEEEQY